MSSKGATRNFSVVLYPDCLEHMNMLDYLLNHDYVFQIVYILHDKDVWEEDTEGHKIGEPKKPHYHVLVHSKNPMQLSAFLKFFHVWIDYAEPVSSVQSLLLYFIHSTPDSMNKFQYSPDELKGDLKIIRSVLQKTHFV